MNTNFIRLMRDPNPKPSLSDIDPNNPKPLPDPPAPAPAPAPAPTPTPAPVEGLNADGTLQDGYEKTADGKVQKKAAPAPAPTPAPGTVEGVNADGTLQEGYIKLEDDTVVKQEESQEEDFWTVVEKLSGIPVEVKYPDGVDPTTPEGVVLREQAIREQAVDTYDAWLEQSDPRSYAYMLHRRSGKPDAEFFQDPSTTVSLPELTVLEGSADVQETIYRQDLINKGVDKEEADALVNAAIKNNKLKEKATASWNNIKKSQDTQLENLKLEQKRVDDTRVAAESELMTELKDNIKALGFIVPDAKQKDYMDFLVKNLMYDAPSGKFLVVQELNRKQLKLQMESLLFQHMNGDLSTLVRKQAATQVAQRLSTQVAKTKLGNNKDAPSSSSTKKLTLGEV